MQTNKEQNPNKTKRSKSIQCDQDLAIIPDSLYDDVAHLHKPECRIKKQVENWVSKYVANAETYKPKRFEFNPGKNEVFADRLVKFGNMGFFEENAKKKLGEKKYQRLDSLYKAAYKKHHINSYELTHSFTHRTKNGYDQEKIVRFKFDSTITSIVKAKRLSEWHF